MDSEKLQQAWKDVCNQVKSYSDVDPSQVDAFFSRLQPQAMSEGFLMLTADTNFIKGWVERHYAPLIRRALGDIHQVPFTVVVEVDDTAAPPADAAAAALGAGGTDMGKGRGEHAEPTPAAPPAPAASTPSAARPPHPLSEPQPIDTNPLGCSSFSEEAEAEGYAPTSSLKFENFVIGDSNRIAYTMAVSVAEAPGNPHLNPLFIYGRSGLGKTHLLRAIQNYVRETMPHLSVVYVDSAELLSDYMEASAAHDKEKSSYKNFKTRYEEADVLLIDDVQYLQGKKQTLDIVFQIFNKLTTQGRQVVLSADRAPKNIDIDERYKSRFNSGGTFDIQPPELETKLGIVKSFIEEYRENEGMSAFSIPEDIQHFIAENSGSNVRELKSAVTKVIYQMTYFERADLTLNDVRSLLENHFTSSTAKRITVADIQREVETFYKVNHGDLVGTQRSRNIAYARHMAIYLCRQLTDLTYDGISSAFNRDHSTAMSSFNKIEDMAMKNREVQEEIEALRQIILDI